jgi:putative transcriptional regulator
MIMAGYEVSEVFAMRPKSFDIIAGNGERIVVLKVISHIDSISEENARDLDRIARNLDGTPVIVVNGPVMLNLNVAQYMSGTEYSR